MRVGREIPQQVMDICRICNEHASRPVPLGRGSAPAALVNTRTGWFSSSVLRQKSGRVVVFLLIVMALLGTSACGSDGPTAAEAGETLKTHVLALLKARSAVDVRIIDPGGRNIACGEGKAKQTFGAVGRDSAGSTDAEALNTMLAGALSRVAHYTVVSAEVPGSPIRAVDASTKTTLVFESPGNGIYQVRGETECVISSRAFARRSRRSSAVSNLGSRRVVPASGTMISKASPYTSGPRCPAGVFSASSASWSAVTSAIA